VLQVFADARPVEHDRNAVLAQLGGRADAGQQQQVGRSDAAGRENDVVSARPTQRLLLPPPHPDSMATVELDALRMATNFEAQIGRFQCRLKESARRRPPPPAHLVDMEKASPFLSTTLEISACLHT